jgi:hypothetical protein
MSNDILISQTIEFGNPFEAIELNLFSCQEFIDYLAKNANEIPKDKLHLSFTALMRLFPSTYHYSSGKHLLSYFPSDTFLHRIFVTMGGSPELPLNKEDFTNTLWSLIFDVYSEFINDTWSEEHEKCMLLCNKITPKLAKNQLIFKDEDFIKTLYLYHCDKVIPLVPLCGVQSKHLIRYTIDADWFDQYPSIKIYYKRYVNRISMLHQNAPLYFEKMSEQFLYQLCSITLREFEKLDFELLKRTAHCFPQQFTDVDVSENFQRIAIYPIGVRSYILGLSCFPKIPSKQKLDEALVKLSNMGIDAYVSELLSNQNYESPPKDKIANEEDTLFENPENYVSLDRFDIEENGKIYQFTRPEFKKLASDKKNFWTKQPISYSDLYSLQVRNQICKELNLPPSEPLKVLIEKGCKGCLYEEPLEKEKESSTTLSNEQVNQSLLYLYQMWLTNPSAFTSLNEAGSNTNLDTLYEDQDENRENQEMNEEVTDEKDTEESSNEEVRNNQGSKDEGRNDEGRNEEN